MRCHTWLNPHTCVHTEVGMRSKQKGRYSWTFPPSPSVSLPTLYPCHFQGRWLLWHSVVRWRVAWTCCTQSSTNSEAGVTASKQRHKEPRPGLTEADRQEEAMKTVLLEKSTSWEGRWQVDEKQFFEFGRTHGKPSSEGFWKLIFMLHCHSKLNQAFIYLSIYYWFTDLCNRSLN